MNVTKSGLATSVVIVMLLSGCGTTTPLPSPSDTAPSAGATTPSAPLDITLLRSRYAFPLGPAEVLQGTLELDGTCVVLEGAAVIFPNATHVVAPDLIETHGATLQIGADIADVQAWELEPIEGSRLTSTDNEIHDEMLFGLEDCPPSRFSEFIVVSNLDATE